MSKLPEKKNKKKCFRQYDLEKTRRKGNRVRRRIEIGFPVCRSGTLTYRAIEPLPLAAARQQ